MLSFRNHFSSRHANAAAGDRHQFGKIAAIGCGIQFAQRSGRAIDDQDHTWFRQSELSFAKRDEPCARGRHQPAASLFMTGGAPDGRHRG